MGFYTDWLWFREVQFTSVFVTVLQAQVRVGVVTGVVFFLILYGNVMVCPTAGPARRPRGNG